ncbi:MAG: dihydroorotate dehydrogenase electron transfer subunit [Candidatus Omnitrophota bacterium]|jgi:dihydroorotate dehydrogenase electron transfer subunit
MLQLTAKILYNKKVKGDYFCLAMRAPWIAKESVPGQFLNIKVSGSYEPLLRRPFSIHKAGGPDIWILYEVVGEATRILSGRKPGEYINVIGPLGKGFDYTLSVAGDRLSILTSGGMGVAPLLFLAEKLSKSRKLALIGARDKEHLLCEKELKDLGCAVRVSTDDGSRGFKGYVGDLLEKELSDMGDTQRAVIYACGPRPLLKEISRVSKKHGIAAQISMEEHMACGIGACLGCVVNTKEGFKRACKEGPVFNAGEVIW